MIGVIARPEEDAAVREFFELFKTPWEYYERGSDYDVVLCTTGEPPEASGCQLLLVYSSIPLEWDGGFGIQGGKGMSQGHLRVEEGELPIYAGVRGFRGLGRSLGLAVEFGEAGLIELERERGKVVRAGFNLFAEVRWLLSRGQPKEEAGVPTLDLHISLLRRLILDALVPVVEIPPAPAGTRHIACLTHDIDFLYLRQHKFDRSMLGFLYRATIGTLLDYFEGRVGGRSVLANWGAVIRLPLVHLGVCKDFWFPFDRYLEAEAGRPSTFYVVPFKNRRGSRSPTGSVSAKRATRYDVGDMEEWIPLLEGKGCEVAVHGIDAWHDPAAGREEKQRLTNHTGEKGGGIRMHWLYFAEDSYRNLEEAGFGYDSTCGYNDAIGFKAGTAQVFRPLGAAALMEVPLHIQDTALFYPGRMHLKEQEAWGLCLAVLSHCRKHGGVATVLWHDRSLAPERLWDRFYGRLLKELSAEPAWFATAHNVMEWFKKRRKVRFAGVRKGDDSITVRLQGLEGGGKPACGLRLSYKTNGGGLEVLDVPFGTEGEVEFRIPRASQTAWVRN